VKLQNKLLLLIIPLIVLPLLALGWVAYQRLKTTAEQTLRGQMETILEQSVLRVGSFEQTTLANVMLFSQSELLHNYLLTDETDRYRLLSLPLLKLFAGYHTAYPEYYELRVLLPDGYEDARYAVDNLPNRTEEEANTPYFQALLAHPHQSYQRYLRNPDDGQSVFLVANSLRFFDPSQIEIAQQKDAPLRGFFVITVQLDFLRDHLRQSHFGARGQLYAADEQGNLLWDRIDGQTQLARRAQETPPDELGRLAGQFNRMAANLANAQQQKDEAQQEALQNKEQAIENLKKTDRLKDEFLANTSHELRTPLNGIIGITQSLLDGVGGELSELQRQNLVMIAQSGKRLSGLVNDILDAYKMQRQELQLQRKPLDVKSIVQWVLELSQALLKTKNITLRNEVPAELPPVYADENRLQQILLNLVGNAIKFTQEGHVSVLAEQEDDTIRIWVQDTGIGIAQDQQAHIFEAFSQGDGSTAREYGGTGLGLSISRQLIELHGGTISVTSQPGEGSMFTFTLPLSQEPLPDTPPTIPIPAFTSPTSEWITTTEISPLVSMCVADDLEGECKLLLVDDEPVNLQVLINYLSSSAYSVTVASSGIEALNILESGYEPDLIILDVMMPRMTGFEVTHIIRNTWQLHELPIVLLTAKSQLQDIITGLEAGANDYLTKPVAKEELLARIRTHLSVKRLKQAHEVAVETARLKSEFLANMSHEIRTPMNAVIGMTDLLSSTELSEEQRDYVTTIRTGSETLLSLINDILDFSKIESGKLELEVRPFDIRTCVEESLDLVASHAAKKGINLAYWIEPGTPELPIGDITRLRQTLVNLLSNAVKFTHQGEVNVEVQACAIPPPNMPEVNDYPWYTFQFAVHDTGIGISEEQQNKLFQSFSQLDASTTRKYGGTGLGLAICKRLTELMGGKIWVKSAQGQGSTFYFTIQEQAQLFNPEQQFWQGRKPHFARKKILIAVDSLMNRHVLKSLFHTWGLEPYLMENAADALDIPLEARGYDCGIFELPASDQVDVALLDRLQDFHRQTTFPLIVLTPICRAPHHGALFTHCLGKPIKPLKLFNVLRQIFQDHHTARNVPVLTETVQSLNKNMRILLAEDNLVNQKVAVIMLKKLGFHADLAINGLEVLSALRERTYDVIFMDVQMPELDGLSTTRRIRGEWPGDQQPWIIAMTANAMEGDRETCLHAGMDDYLSKPIRPESVQQALLRYQAK